VWAWGWGPWSGDCSAACRPWTVIVVDGRGGCLPTEAEIGLRRKGEAPAGQFGVQVGDRADVAPVPWKPNSTDWPAAIVALWPTLVKRIVPVLPLRVVFQALTTVAPEGRVRVTVQPLTGTSPR
jgi:hypothetical protein